MSQLSDNLLLLAIISSQVILWRNTSALTPNRNKVSPKGLLLPEFMLLNLNVPGKWYLGKLFSFFPNNRNLLSHNLCTWEVSVQFSSFNRSVMFDSLWPHGLQQARPPCPSPTPGVHSDSCPLNRWCHPTVSFCHPPSLPTFNLSQHQGLFKWVSSSNLMAKGLEFQLQHQCFQWTFRTDFL